MWTCILSPINFCQKEKLGSNLGQPLARSLRNEKPIIFYIVSLIFKQTFDICSSHFVFPLGFSQRFFHTIHLFQICFLPPPPFVFPFNFTNDWPKHCLTYVSPISKYFSYFDLFFVSNPFQQTREKKHGFPYFSPILLLYFNKTWEKMFSHIFHLFIVSYVF